MSATNTQKTKKEIFKEHFQVFGNKFTNRGVTTFKWKKIMKFK